MELTSKLLTTHIILALSGYFVLGDTAVQSCSSNEEGDMLLIIESRRNDTGHWISQVDLVNDGATDEQAPWTVDVHQHKTSCRTKTTSAPRSKSYVTITATLASPDPSDAQQGSFRHVQLSPPSPWRGALRECRRKGGRLAHFSPFTFNSIHDLLYSHGVDEAFLNLCQDARSGHRFVPASGNPESIDHSLLDDLAKNGPFSNVSCAAATINFRLKNVSCEDPLPFVCEFQYSVLKHEN